MTHVEMHESPEFEAVFTAARFLPQTDRDRFPNSAAALLDHPAGDSGAAPAERRGLVGIVVAGSVDHEGPVHDVRKLQARSDDCGRRRAVCGDDAADR
jgi:hypothetical protein